MDGKVREILCSSCIHSKVCSHKDDYQNVLKSLQDIFYKFPENKREFIHLKDPDCKFHFEGLSTPKFLKR